MLRLHRPRTCPAVLATQGRRKAQEHSALYDGSLPHRTGRAQFPIAERIYRHPSVRRALHRAQRGKCCYCESKAMPFEVEHYRPKSAVRQARGTPEQRPGYYWLAYEWQNLLYSCVLCNQPREDERGDATGKGSLFPLADPTRRARSHHDDLAQEEPLLLDPYEDDPEQHIAYSRFMPRGRTPRGEATLAVLKLRGRSQLARPRDRWEQIQKRLERLFGEPALPPEFQQECLEDLWEMAADGAEYAAMARAALRAWGLPGPPQRNHAPKTAP